MSELPTAAKTCGIRTGDIDSVPDRFKCSGCKQVLREPVQAECGHRFCKQWVALAGSAAIDCIACQEDGEDPVPKLSLDSVAADTSMSRELARTEFYCPWIPECKVRKRLPELMQHAESECEFRQVNCELCDLLLSATALEKHKETECKHRRIPCEQCKEKVPHDMMQAHLDTECIGSTKQCESCPARVRDTEEARLNHVKTECPVKWLDNEPCPFGCGVVRDARAHREQFVTLHLDRLRVGSLGLGRVSTAAASQQAQIEASLATAPETPSNRMLPAAWESRLFEIEDIISKAELVDKLEKFGLPHCPRQARDTSAQKAFFSSIHSPALLVQELENVQSAVAQKLGDAIRAVDPLAEQMEKLREHQELCVTSSPGSELSRKLDRMDAGEAKLERKIALLELGSTDGSLVWKIASFSQRCDSADDEVFSPILFTDKFGYKLVAVAYLNGHNAGRGSHLSLFCRLLQGPYDAAQRWPFRRRVTAILVDQRSGNHKVMDLVKEYRSEQSSQFQRPSQPLGQLFGCEKFVPKEELESKGFLKDDTMFVRLQVSA